MKYYIYVSDSKVDMLLPQIPKVFKEKESIERGVDSSIFGAKVKSELATPEERISRLQILTSFIEGNADLGTVGSPKAWITGQTDVKYGFIGQDKNAIGFGGAEGKTLFLLIGSASHIVGMPPGPEKIGGYSFLPFLMSIIQRATREAIADSIIGSGPIENTISYEYGTMEHNLRMLVQNGSYVFPESVIMKVQFLAKVLLFIGGDQPLIIATPLYVAQSDSL